jgi:hypothetical protein
MLTQLDPYIVRLTTAFAAPAAAVALFVIALFRYLRDNISARERKLVRSSLLLFAVHPVPATLGIRFVSQLYLVGGEQFALAMLLVTLATTCIGLFTSIYLGFRSRVPAGRRVAFAGIALIIGIVAGDLGLFYGLFSKVVS